MPISGIIAEYNPFHNGHAQHIAAARETSSGIVVVMSGNFTQRGEPAICDKWRRTRMALLNGADLVIELPLYYATAAAEYFARGAVTLLYHTQIVDKMCFGSECGDINALKKIASALSDESGEFKALIREKIKQGFSYPMARGEALKKVFPEAEHKLLECPNNTLGVEYIKALETLGSGIEPFTVKRGLVSGENITAKRIRGLVREANWNEAARMIPASTFKILNEAAEASELASPDNLSGAFQYAVRTAGADNLTAFADISDGLENRFAEGAARCYKLSEILSFVKSKRYTLTRLQRAALHIILGVRKERLNAYEASGGPQYIRVLGFRRERVDLLRALTEKATLPVVVNLKNAPLHDLPLALQMLKEEIRSSDLYALAFENGKSSGIREKKIHGLNHEFSMPPVIID